MKKPKLIILCLLVLAVIFAVLLIPKAPNVSQAALQVNLTLEYGNGTISNFENIEMFSNSTVYDALIEASNSNGFRVQSQFNEQFKSKLITSIGDLEGKDGKYWTYFVNSEFASVGSD